MRRQRLRRGLALADAARALGVDAKSLRALEWDRGDLLASPGEADRIERRYAAFLGLQVETEETEETEAAEAPPPRRVRRPLWLALLALIAPLAIALGYALGAVISGDGGREAAAELGPRPRDSSTVSIRNRNVPSTSVQAPVAAPRTRPVNLVLTADLGDSWVEARSGSPTGPLLFRGTLAGGRKLRVAAKRIWVRLGAASNLSLAVNGRLAPRELQGTVDVLVTRQGIRRT